jgi:hypothetical protein
MNTSLGKTQRVVFRRAAHRRTWSAGGREPHLGAVTIIPTALVLRRLLVRNSYPILNAIVILYFVGQLRILAASLPVLARFIFLGQLLGASIFLVWVLRSWRLPAEAVETHGRIWRTIRAIAKIGLIILPAAFLANIFGYVNLGEPFGNHIFQERFRNARMPPRVMLKEPIAVRQRGWRR